MAVEFADLGVRVNAVAPGEIENALVVINGLLHEVLRIVLVNQLLLTIWVNEYYLHVPH